MEDMIRYGTQAALFVLGVVVSWITYKITKRDKIVESKEAKLGKLLEDHEVRIRYIEHVMGAEMSEVKALIKGLQSDLYLIKKLLYKIDK